jgi:hypothetical protein
MTRYADPHRCPDCRGPITYGAAFCTTCGLPLTGPVAQRLYVVLASADELLTSLRAGSGRQSAPAADPASSAPTAGPALPAPTSTLDVPAFPVGRPTGRRRTGGLAAASVPRILLTLGAGCLLVAALVFLAVTWSVLGVGGRTAVLVGLTAAAGGLAGWMSVRGLRAAAESLALVGYGLLVLDVLGADRSGWFGDLSMSGLTLLIGAVLAPAAAAGALAVRRTTGRSLLGAEVVVGIGSALAAVGIGTGDRLALSAALVAGTLAAAAVTAAADRLDLHLARAGAGVVTAGAWLTLALQGLGRALDAGSWRDLWIGLEVWPLLVAALLVAAPAVSRRFRIEVRIALMAVGQLLLAVAVLPPLEQLTPTGLTVAALAVLVVCGVATRLLPRPWYHVNLLSQLVFGLGTLLAVLMLLSEALERVGDAVEHPWAGAADGVLPRLVAFGDLPAPWLLPLCVLALLGTSWLLARDSAAAPAGLRVQWLAAGAAVLAGSVLAALALYPVPVWLVLAAALLAGAGFVAWWAVGRERTGPATTVLAAAGVLLAGAIVLSLHAELLTASALLVVLALTGLVHLRAADTVVSAVTGVVLGASLAGSVWSWGAVLDAEPSWVAAAGLVVLGATVLVAPYAPARWWASEEAFARTGVEAGAAASAVPLTLAGIALAPAAEQATWAAVLLTVAGGVVTAMSLLRPDRRLLGWPGGALLAAASWVRLWDVGVTAPEAYTLPSAVALLLVGLVHLHRHRDAATMTALAPGLGLALVPSLLWVLADPVGPRSVLLGLGCLGLVLAGVRLGWTAPIVLGSTVGGLLVLRLAAPYVGDAVPRWVLIGGAGALLVAVGATWEHRAHEARQLLGYVRTLR